MSNYYQEKLVKQEKQLEVAKCGVVNQSKRFINAAKILIDRKELSFEDVVEIEVELSSLVEVVETIQKEVDNTRKWAKEELEKEHEEKKLEAHKQAIKEAKELLKKEGVLIIDEVNRNENN